MESNNNLVRLRGPISLKRLGAGDADEYFDLFDANRRHISDHDPRLASGFMTIGSVKEQLAPYSAKHRIYYGIIEGNDFIGSTALLMRKDASADIAYWVDRGRIGRGIATEACRLTINSGVIDFGKRQFDAVIAPTNLASIRVVQKLGFERSQILEQDEIYRLDLNTNDIN